MFRTIHPFSHWMSMAAQKLKLICVKEAGKFFPIAPKGDTIRAWMRTGVRDRWGHNAGEAIVLRSECVGGRIMTTEAWIKDFIAMTQRNGRASSKNAAR